jgi:hypothetical protein
MADMLAVVTGALPRSVKAATHEKQAKPLHDE